MLNKHMTWTAAVAIALGLWLTVSAPVKAQNIVVPNANAAVAGNSDNRFPFLVTGGMRWQEVFAASQFAVGPQTINQLALRNGIFLSTAFSSNISSIQISLSTTSLAPDGLSTTFASNIGGDNTVVYTGSLTLSSTNAAGPGNTHVFDVLINFQTPFDYNSSLGNLLLDVQNNSGADAFVGSNFFDSQSTAGDSVSRVFGPEGSPGATSGTADTNGLIAQFHLASAVPEPSSLALMGLGGAALVGMVRRRRAKRRKS